MTATQYIVVCLHNFFFVNQFSIAYILLLLPSPLLNSPTSTSHKLNLIVFSFRRPVIDRLHIRHIWCFFDLISSRKIDWDGWMSSELLRIEFPVSIFVITVILNRKSRAWCIMSRASRRGGLGAFLFFARFPFSVLVASRRLVGFF